MKAKHTEEGILNHGGVKRGLYGAEREIQGAVLLLCAGYVQGGG